MSRASQKIKAKLENIKTQVKIKPKKTCFQKKNKKLIWGQKIFQRHLLMVISGTLFFFLLLFFFSSAWQIENQVLGASQQLDIKRIVELINLERAKKGVGPVALNAQLNHGAEKKGYYMFARDYWAHMAPDGTSPWQFIHEAGYTYQSAGENLARNFYTEETLIEAWMASPTHRANILNPNFTDIGVSVLEGIIDQQAVLLVVNFFGQPKSHLTIFKQVAVYDQQADSLVLAGEIMPEGSLSMKPRFKFKLVHFLYGFLIIGFVGYIYYALRQQPYRRRKTRRKK